MSDYSRLHPSADDRPSAAGFTRFSGGVQGNARLTALTGTLLLVLFFVEGLTLLHIRALFTVHVFVGFVLLPPVGVKLASTGYRFAMYYLGDRRYRAAGAPQIVLRLIGPFLILSAVGLLGTGVALLVAGPGDNLWRRLHILFFLAWFWLMTIHVLAHTGRAVLLSAQDLGGTRIGGTFARQSLVVASLALGLAIAVAALPFNSAWLHGLSGFGFDH